MVSGKLTASCLLALTTTILIQHTSADCDESTDIIKLEQGKSYVYEFSSVTTLHQDASTNGSKLVVSGSAILTKSEPCEYILSLENLGIVNQDSKAAAIPESLAKTAVRFTRKNGVVDGFYVSDKEHIWTINIKRAIVSMLQNKVFSSDSASAASTMELSVSGHCPTMHSKSENKYVKQIDLNECAQRETAPYSNLGVSYDVSPGTYRNTHQLLNSSSHCDQEVADGVIKAVTCSEEHEAFHYKSPRFWFTLVQSSLVLKSTEAAKYTAEQISQMKQDTGKQSTIVFDQSQKKIYLNGVSAEKNGEDHVKNILLRLESDIDQAELYMDLVETFKELENPMDIYSSKEFVLTKKAKTLFLNAAFETDTAASLRFISQLMQTDIHSFHSLHHHTLNKFFKTISFSSNPKVEGVDSLEALVNGVVMVPAETRRARHLNDLILLGSSGYANRLCFLFSEECSTGYAASLKKLSDTIAKYVKMDSSINYMDRNIFVSSLHALGNLNHLSPDAVGAISNVLKATQPDWMKIVALQAFRSDPCQKDLKEAARNLLNEASSSNDLKINSYLALSKCITSDDVEIVEKALKEPEVGGFISSHVSNMQDSVSPSKQQLKNSMSIIKLPTEVAKPEDKSDNSVYLTQSRYIEYSYYDSKNNIGFSAAAILIFNSDSTIPASVTFELTIDALGRSYNVLEASLSTRILRQRYVNEGTLDTFNERFGLVFTLLPYTLDASDSYFRHFGVTTNIREVHAIKLFNRDDDLFSNCLSHILQGVNITDSTFEMVKTIPLTFFDIEFLYPTISGLPLSLDIQAGSLSSISVNVTGTADFDDLKYDFIDASADFKSLIRKSTAGSFKKVLRIGKPHVTPITVGIMKEKNLDAATEFGIDLFKQNITATHLKINLPLKDILTVSYSKKTYFFEDINGVMNKIAYSNPTESTKVPICYKGLRELSSLETCVIIDFPYNGMDRNAQQFNLTLRKYDDSLQYYEFKWDAVYGSDHKDVKTLTFDTPGTRINRKTVVQFTSDFGGSCDSNEMVFRSTNLMKVESPWRNFDVTYAASTPQYWCENYNISAERKFLYNFQVKFSESEVYEWNLKMADKGRQLTPNTGEIIESLPSSDGYEFSTEFSRPTPSSTPQKYSVLGSLSQKNENGNSSVKGVVTVAGDWWLAQLIGEVEVDGDSSFTDTEYNAQQRFNLKSKVLDKVNYQMNYRSSRQNIDNSMKSSLEINGKTYEHTSAFKGTELMSNDLPSTFTGKYELDGTYKELPGDKWSKLHAVYNVETSEERAKRDAYAILSFDGPQSPISWNGTSLRNNTTIDSVLNIDFHGENVAKIEKRLDYAPNQYKGTVNVFVKDHVDLQAKSEMNVDGPSTTVDTNVQATCLRSKRFWKYLEKVKADSSLITKHCEATWGHDGKNDGTMVSDTTIHLEQRNLESKTTITIADDISTKTVNATLAQDFLNGHSGIVVTFTSPDKWSRLFMAELDTTNDQDKQQATSMLHFYIEDSASPKEEKKYIPLNCTLNKAYNWNNAQPEAMAFTHSASSNFNCIRGCPDDCQQMYNVKSLFESTMTSARDLYTMTGMVSTVGSKFIPELDLKSSFEVIGPQETLLHNGIVRVNGSSQDATDLYAMSVASQYECPKNEYAWHDYTTFAITKTSLSTGDTTILADGDQNSTRIFKSLTNFDISESGKVMTPMSNFTWARVIRLNPNKFLVLYRLAENEKILTLIEFVINMKKENHQMKIDVISKNNFDHKPSNFNFTLTR